MGSEALVGLIHRVDNETVETHRVTVNRNEIAAVEVLSERIFQVTKVKGPCKAFIQSDERTVTVYDYEPLKDFTIDDTAVVGVDDLSVGGTFTGTAPMKFEVRISDAAASPDKFKVSIDDAAEGAETAITAGAAQVIGSGVEITFVAGDGHTLDSTWTIMAYPSTGTFDVDLYGDGG